MPASQRRASPAPLTREAVFATAFELVQEEGYDGTSMRRLAQRLGVSAMAVQRVSGGREALDDALVTWLVEAERDALPDWPKDWEGVLRQYADLLRRLCRRHPAILAALVRRPLVSPFAQEVVDRVLGTLIAAGLDARTAADVFLAVRDYVTGHVSVETHRHGGRLELLPGMDHLEAARASLSDLDLEEQYDRGLGVLLAGVEALISR